MKYETTWGNQTESTKKAKDKNVTVSLEEQEPNVGQLPFCEADPALKIHSPWGCTQPK